MTREYRITTRRSLFRVESREVYDKDPGVFMSETPWSSRGGNVATVEEAGAMLTVLKVRDIENDEPWVEVKSA